MYAVYYLNIYEKNYDYNIVMIVRNSSHFGDDLSLHLSQSCEADGMAQVNHLQQWGVPDGAQQRSCAKATRPGQRLQKTMGKPMGKPWENGDLYGKIMKDPPCYSWDISLFRLGHFLCRFLYVYQRVTFPYEQNWLVVT